MGCFEEMDAQMQHKFRLMGSFMIFYMTLVVVLLLNVRPLVHAHTQTLSRLGLVHTQPQLDVH